MQCSCNKFDTFRKPTVGVHCSIELPSAETEHFTNCQLISGGRAEAGDLTEMGTFDLVDFLTELY